MTSLAGSSKTRLEAPTFPSVLFGEVIGTTSAGPALWPIVIASGATLLGALGGVALGRILEGSGEQKRWRRDQMAAAFGRYISAADTFFVEVCVDDTAVDRNRAHAAYTEFTQAGALVDVFAAPEVTHAAHLVWNWAAEIMNDWDSYLRITEDEQWEPRAREFRRLLVSFTNAARRSLGESTEIAVSALA